MAIVVGVLFVILGVLSLVAKDMIWRLQEYGSAGRGNKIERTPAWDRAQTVWGLVLLGLGAFILLWFGVGG